MPVMSATSDDTYSNNLTSPQADETTATTASRFTPVNGKSPPTHQSRDIAMDEPRTRSRSSDASPDSDMSGLDNEPVRRVSQGPINGHRYPPVDDHARAPNSPGKRKRVDSDTEDAGPVNVDSAYEQRRRPGEAKGHGSRATPEPSGNSWHKTPEQGGQGSHPPYGQSYPPEGHTENLQWYPRASEENSEAHLVDALQRENRNMDAQRRPNGIHADQNMSTPVATPAPGMELTAAGVHVDPKKRKRVFSNRTKTGCQTCRKRKKKCDEAKPECNNCTRGGFVCEGYNSKNPWPKPGSQGAINKMPQQVLQSKMEMGDTRGLYPKPSSSRDSIYEDPPVRPGDGGRGRPIMVEEDHENRGSSGPSPWSSNKTWGETSNRQYLSDRTPSHGYAPSHSISHHPRELAERPASNHMMQRPMPPVQRINSSQSAMTAQLALQHSTSALRSVPPPPPPGHPLPPLSEKDKMLRGELYKMFDAQLVDEREACKAALWRFNNSTNPSIGVSREERARLFKAILEPPFNGRAHPMNTMVGRLGKDVCVEAPFTCDYGYNINIGDDVVIGSNCTILDACNVSIGARTVIGNNVNLYANNFPKAKDRPRDRSGSKGSAQGNRILIEEDAFIGGNSTILPGISIGRGAVVGAGSVVVRNVADYVVVAGNPARNVHGIWANPADTHMRD
ncbi:trimeric LpxA-like protein [Aulographum hederae CBS 113979]|uniref:Trimeric LpxA-like protein n=1 Tax=Aulographum hederae CBS 113979 TaxID=1176131 RepID=A0A6G1H0G7_9PEZI|nr:trimeric LpxA-like protein [Aulographum hederae CBS 113979]